MIKKSPYTFFISLLTLIVCFMLSCKFNGSFQGLTSYKNETQKLYPELIAGSNEFGCNHEGETFKFKVYPISGTLLKECLKVSERNLLYLWAPRCKSANCISLSVLQTLCTKEQINLYVIAEYYDGFWMNMNYGLINPILAIDTDYYNSNVTGIYRSRFMQDFLGNEVKRQQAIFFKLQYDSLIQTSSNIDSLFMNL